MCYSFSVPPLVVRHEERARVAGGFKWFTSLSSHRHFLWPSASLDPVPHSVLRPWYSSVVVGHGSRGTGLEVPFLTLRPSRPASGHPLQVCRGMKLELGRLKDHGDSRTLDLVPSDRNPPVGHDSPTSTVSSCRPSFDRRGRRYSLFSETPETPVEGPLRPSPVRV